MSQYLSVYKMWMRCIGISLFFWCSSSYSQTPKRQSNILFYQLTTAEGLSDNYINDLTVDKNGVLWIATGEGLNSFNGKNVAKFFKEEYPQLQSDNIGQVVCDDNNRIWVLSADGNVTIIDEERRFHHIGLYKNNKFIKTRRILQTRSGKIILFTRDNHFGLDEKITLLKKDSLTAGDFSTFSVSGFSAIQPGEFTRVEPFDEDSYLFTTDSFFYKVNYTTRALEKKFDIHNSRILTKWGRNEMLVYNKTTSLVEAVDLSTLQRTFPFDHIPDQFGNFLTARINDVKKINEQEYLLTTRKQGVYIFNTATHTLFNQRHVAADPTTIVNNVPTVIAVDNTGWVFLGATPNGISYFKSNAVIGQQTIFLDTKGNSYDGYINKITSRDNDTYYIATSSNLLQWKRSTNSTDFLNYATIDGKPLMNNEGISFVTFDKLNRLWVATGSKGIIILDENKKLLKRLQYDSTGANSIPPKLILQLYTGPDGYMWLCGEGGICRVNTKTFEVDNLANTPLRELSRSDCFQTFFQDEHNLWIATATKGLWHYDFSTRQLNSYNTKNGFISNTVFCLNKDRFNNIYAGTNAGLQILLHNGKTKIITQKEGLLNKRVEALLLDKSNRMWIGNDVGLACFNIADTSLKFFDESYGLSIQGFRLGSYQQNSDDELIWGTERGLQYYYPDDLYNQKINFKININRVETRNFTNNLTQNTTLKLSPVDNYITFYFSAIDYRTHLRTFYEYQLDGLDPEWIEVVNQDFVRYSALPPGKYIFKVRASNDNKHWKNSENEITIIVAAPFYKTWWFKLLGILLSLFLFWVVFKYFQKNNIKKREELETELVIIYFASQINSHKNTVELLWDVAKNCISKLHFEDCVIYLKDGERNVLVQIAAYGPKNQVDFTIHQPIEIPFGKGIVGAVAQSGKPELVNSTEEDSRYIVDDEKRFSEIAVPIIIDKKVIGVIDSEHHQKNFFTQKHLQVLSTIAVLCANHIQKTKAEEEKQKATIELLENKQKAVESRLQSLRLQMNPHFLFNALNSIQQMILANEEIVATKYLSKFSKLLRTILVHSDKEAITLKEELEILNLYIELESIRFKDSFSYKIVVDENIETEEIKIPTLLIQPFVENAIWHGLMHKEGERLLKVEFNEEKDFIKCSIADNGIGRQKAAEMKMATGQDKKHTSKGIEVSKERLKTLRTRDGREGTITITDLVDKFNQACGTKVVINFPIQN